MFLDLQGPPKGKAKHDPPCFGIFESPPCPIALLLQGKAITCGIVVWTVQSQARPSTAYLCLFCRALGYKAGLVFNSECAALTQSIAATAMPLAAQACP